jgi:predicted NBD/HSP70 family sugar kinase
VLSSIQVSEGTSRVEIAQRTGLTAQTVSVIVRRLIESGIVQESGSVPSAGGKPRRTLRINPTAAYVVGIHFDPTEVSIVVVDMTGQALARSHHELSPGLKPEALIDQAAQVARKLLANLGVLDERVLGVGAACPGPIDQSRGLVVSPPRRDRWTEVPIKRLLKHYIGFEVIIDNDANAAAIGERWAGHGRSASDFAFLYLGTGIGGAMFLSNNIYRGASLNAGEFGHIVVEPNGTPCYCGNCGCLEAMCSSAAITRNVHAELDMGRESLLAPVYQKDPVLVDHAAICLAAVQRDEVARRVIDKAAEYIAECAVTIAGVRRQRRHPCCRHIQGQGHRVLAVSPSSAQDPHRAGGNFRDGRRRCGPRCGGPGPPCKLRSQHGSARERPGVTMAVRDPGPGGAQSCCYMTAEGSG